ncbi:MAG: hypothetical protein IH984_15025 [Planctomycetes bacterium]|nr:hypothetical protein [Planctomycetota bacterium]
MTKRKHTQIHTLQLLIDAEHQAKTTVHDLAKLSDWPFGHASKCKGIGIVDTQWDSRNVRMSFTVHAQGGGLPRKESADDFSQ